MDKKDTAIIQRLQENSRASIRDIAKKTGIRPSTVHQRITRLKKEEIIDKFTIKLNNVKNVSALLIALSNMNKIGRFFTVDEGLAHQAIKLIFA